MPPRIARFWLQFWVYASFPTFNRFEILCVRLDIRNWTSKRNLLPVDKKTCPIVCILDDVTNSVSPTTLDFERFTRWSDSWVRDSCALWEQIRDFSKWPSRRHESTIWSLKGVAVLFCEHAWAWEMWHMLLYVMGVHRFWPAHAIIPRCFFEIRGKYFSRVLS